MFTADGFIRADGLMQHSMYVFQVKTPAESKGPWDLLQARADTMSGEAGVRQARRFGLPAGQEVARRVALPRRVRPPL